jgi:hypothetical protein
MQPFGRISRVASWLLLVSDLLSGRFRLIVVSYSLLVRRWF